MDFLSEFSKRLSNAARSVVVSDKDRDNAEAARLNEELRAASAELDQLFAAYGRIRFAGENGDAAADLTARIRSGMARVEALSARREEWYGGRRCEACGAPQSRSARFCAGCGKRLTDVSAPEEPAIEAQDYCPRCGAAMASGERFCPVCGADSAAQDAAPEAPFVPDARTIERIDVEEPAPGDAD